MGDIYIDDEAELNRPKRSELVAAVAASRRWGITPEIREQCMRRAVQLIKAEKDRDALRAIQTILAMEAQNIGDEERSAGGSVGLIRVEFVDESKVDREAGG
jgi:hypothetical protein